MVVTIDEQLWGMSDAELNAFPLGIVRLDKHGIIHLFNAAEEKFVHKRAADVIGRNYFIDVAPCTAVKAFQGRFANFVNTPAATSETFGFFFPFDWGHKEVRITICKCAGTDWIYVVTDIGSVTDDDSPRH